MKNIFEIRNIKKIYGDKEILNDVTVSIEKGKIYGLVGKNGAGKSTLLKLLVGLVKSDGGTIYYKGKEPKDDLAHLKDFGVLIEEATFYKGINVKEILKIHCEYMGYYDEDERDRIIEKLGLLDYKKKEAKVLSKGEKQRLAIARAVITKPKILILDEPTIGLDPSFINIVRDMILKLKEEYGTTVIISSHVLTDLELFIDEVLFLRDGEIAEKISMEEIKENCGKYLEIKIDYAAKAAVVLEKELHIKNYKIFKDNMIRINNLEMNCNRVVKELNDNGVQVFEFSRKEVSLNEYYLDIIEGGN